MSSSSKARDEQYRLGETFIVRKSFFPNSLLNTFGENGTDIFTLNHHTSFGTGYFPSRPE